MSFKYAYLLPILCPIWFYTTFIITYVISVYKKDVPAVFPYISDTGTWSPQSCIFGLAMNIGAIIQASVIYVRYRQVKYLLDKDTSFSSSVKKNNKISLYLGIIATFGVCIVGNFQETNALVMHVGGAALAFGLGSIYQCIQTKISYQLYPTVGIKTINFMRLLCSVTCCVMFMLTGACAGLAFLQFTGDDLTKWKENDGGYLLHFISAITEWILAIVTVLFLALYTHEFRKLSFSEPPITEAPQQA